MSDTQLTAPLDYYENAEGWKATNTCTLTDLIEAIREGTFAERVAEVRAFIAAGDKPSADLVKKRLPAVSLSGVVVGRRKAAVAEGRFQHSGLLQIDLDAKDNPGWSVDEMVEALQADPHIVAGFVTPSGEGVKGIARIPADATTHKAAFLAAEIHFAALNLTIDKSCKDPVRLCFVSHDPEAWLADHDGEEFEPIVEQEEFPTSPDDDDDEEHEERHQRGDRPTRASHHISDTGALIIRGGDSFPELDAATVADMLRCIPYPGYQEWLKITNAVWDAIGEDGTALLQAWAPEKKPGDYAEKWAHRLTDVTAATLVMRAKENGYRSPIRTGAGTLNAIPTTPPSVNLTMFSLSDAGNAERFASVHGEDVRFISESGKWIVWNGQRWAHDVNGGVVRRFIATMRETARQAAGVGDADRAKMISSFALGSTNAGRVASGLSLAQSIEGMTLSSVQLDADPWVIGTKTGFIDLRSGRFLEPDRRRLITKIIGTDYDPSASCPIWLSFLQTATGGDDELKTYLQAAVGYSLTGSNREQCLFFLHGLGRNGKGVFTETIKALFGGYAITASESMFTSDRNSSATNDIARLAGCRLAVAAELEEGACFAESRLKSLTGGDAITARFLHREFFDFPPTHHFLISGNHKPSVKGTDLGIWRRLRLLPFTAKIADRDVDPNLAEKLRGELPGILNWGLEGCLHWQRAGLVSPKCVLVATADYRKEEDIIGQFLEECIATDSDGRELQSSVFERYVAWAGNQGIKRPNTSTMFNRKLDERGIERAKVRGGRFWKGITINENQ